MGRKRHHANFGNWIRRRIVFRFALAGLFLLAGATWIDPVVLKIPLALIGAATLMMASYLLAVYICFSDRGGGFQKKLWTLTLEKLDWAGNGFALDIGCGNGALTVLLADRLSSAHVTGIDVWPPDWEYDQTTCLRNAEAFGVENRTQFLEGSAAHIPFADTSFDALVSHFVFHEVDRPTDKFEVVVEAIRVLKPGAPFSFQDMFLDPRYYGSKEDLLRSLEALELAHFELTETGQLLSLPALLNNRRALKCAAVLCGVK